MKRANRALTTFLLMLFLSFSTSAFAAPKKKPSSPIIDDTDIQAAYQQLILNRPSAPIQSHQQINSKNKAISIAKKQLKVRYRWGGTTPKRGFDCSGLTQYAFNKANISLPRTAASQYKNTQRVALSQLQTGDLIFFHTRRRKSKRVDHVGIYLGDNKFIHAPRRGKTVSITSLNTYWKRKVVGAGRV